MNADIGENYMRSRIAKSAVSVFLAFLLCFSAALPGFAHHTMKLPFVSSSANQTYLNITGRKSLKEIKKILDEHPGLKKVDMFDTPVNRESIGELETRYPGIEFGWTINFGEHTVRTDATAFSTLHRSKSHTHGTEDISLLRYCKKLKALDFGHNSCDDLSFLKDLKDLRVLIIACNRITDISPVAGLKKLEYFEMFSNHVQDLTPLKGLTHLMDLNIGFNNINDYSPLYEMPWLKRLWLYNSNNYNKNDPVPQDVINKLKSSLPNTEIDYVNNPTAGTWRLHPHYKVIHAMFRSPDGYVPFDDSFRTATRRNRIGHASSRS